MDAPRSAAAPPVVGIGASAGGLEALQAFFAGLPERTAAAFVVILHLSPEHRSDLAAVLGRSTPMPVAEVRGRARLEADRVYVIPPDRSLQFVDAELAALPFEEPRGHRAPIDLFFRSLAEQHGDGFAVILSGSGSDGAVGARAVKEQGGLVLVLSRSPAGCARSTARRHAPGGLLVLQARHPAAPSRPARLLGPAQEGPQVLEARRLGQVAVEPGRPRRLHVL